MMTTPMMTSLSSVSTAILLVVGDWALPAVEGLPGRMVEPLSRSGPVDDDDDYLLLPLRPTTIIILIILLVPCVDCVFPCHPTKTFSYRNVNMGSLTSATILERAVHTQSICTLYVMNVCVYICTLCYECMCVYMYVML